MKRDAIMVKAEQVVSADFCAAMMDQPFFAAVLMPMQRKFTRSVPTFAVDGKSLFINPDFCLSLNPEQRMFVLCHEAMHLALLHPFRKQWRDHKLANIAMDYVVNGILKGTKGIEIPEGALVNSKYDGWAWEQVYADLSQNQPPPPPPPPGGEEGDGDGGGDGGGEGDQDGEGEKEGEGKGGGDKEGEENGKGKGKGKGKGNGQGDGNGSGEGDGDGGGDYADKWNDPQQWGEVNECPIADESERSKAEAETKRNIMHAASIAKQRGNTPGGMERILEEAICPAPDIEEILMKFVSEHCDDDYDWMRPSRRYSGGDFVLPSLHSECVGELVIAVDTSGSITDEEFAKFMAKLGNVIRSCRPSNTHVIVCDAAIHAEHDLGPYDDISEVKGLGGGGTSHVPVFNRIEELMAEGREIKCVVCLTDLYTMFPQEEPGIPVLWAVYNNPNGQAPFGEVVTID